MALRLLQLSAMALLASRAVSRSQPHIQQIVIPAHRNENATSVVQYTSGREGFDAPKVHPVNATTYDWWYFDAVQQPVQGDDGSQAQAHVAFTFYTLGSDSFEVLTGQFPNGLPSGNMVQITLAWPNGTIDLPIDLPAGDAIIFVEGDGSSGNFTGTGCSWKGTQDLSAYVVHINVPEHEINGTLYIRSDAPPHYACGPAEEGQNLHLAPGAGWANAIPGGPAFADFTIRGEKLRFNGRGYHDKASNFGSEPFQNALAVSHWGHGTLGEYNIVWYDSLTPNGDEVVSAYVSKNGDILTTSCEPGAIEVRPYGDNSTYPPTSSLEPATGFRINATLPEGQLELEAQYIYIVLMDGRYYQRFTGNITGTLNGNDLPDGTGLWEQFFFNNIE
ncbi:uncharacterized protein DSM5745_03143 [Aspergillus mulundensis]|uniref:Hydroxyneurosporene synthase n=1 Tax=Aspergillus mulundensis TaxID=1810919 RepID=A0A3D8SJZ7_9EURO|nr:hypothetical protein DSM5745_03143 [Aspergillus mulundensis]RDW86501.1 hypothetical protein DSM5745_03143 [Aspergillus mulundensis]